MASRPVFNARKNAEELLKSLKRDYPNFDVKKHHANGAIYVTLPREQVRVPVSANHGRDTALLETIVDLSQRLATAMVRETMATTVNTIIEQVSAGILLALKDKLSVASAAVVESTVTSIAKQSKEKFSFDTDKSFHVPYDPGVQIKGSTGQSITKTDDLQDTLDQLSKLDLSSKK